MNESVFDRALRSITEGVNEIAGPTNQGKFIVTHVEKDGELLRWRLDGRYHDKAEAIQKAEDLRDVDGVWSRVTLIENGEYEEVWDSGHTPDGGARDTKAPPRMRSTVSSVESVSSIASTVRAIEEAETPRTYHVTTGTLQPMVVSKGGGDGSLLWSVHFGLPQYDSTKPILTARTKAAVQPIINALNNGSMSEEQAEIALKKIN